MEKSKCEEFKNRFKIKIEYVIISFYFDVLLYFFWYINNFWLDGRPSDVRFRNFDIFLLNLLTEFNFVMINRFEKKRSNIFHSDRVTAPWIMRLHGAINRECYVKSVGCKMKEFFIVLAYLAWKKYYFKNFHVDPKGSSQAKFCFLNKLLDLMKYKIKHGLLYIWMELLLFFLADLPTWGGKLGPKLHPRGEFFVPWLFKT